IPTERQRVRAKRGPMTGSAREQGPISPRECWERWFPALASLGRMTRRGARRPRSVAHHHQAILAGFAAPRFAGTAEHLADVGGTLVAREGGVGFGCGVEALDRIRLPVGRPHPVLVVDID